MGRSGLRTVLIAALAAVAAGLGAAAPASAQYSDWSPPSFDWLTPHIESQRWCNVSWCRVKESSAPSTPQERARERAQARRQARREAQAERRKKARERAQERRRLAANARALAYTPDPDVSNRVRSDLIQHFAPGDAPEALALRAELEGPNNPLAQFSRGMARDTGWSGSNVADVYAFALILMWMTLNQVPSTTPAVDEAVRKDIRASMAAAKSVYGASDADQQELAERIASWTVVFVGQHNHLKGLGDGRPAEFPTPEAFRETIAQYGRSRHLFGIDLSAVDLTSKGISVR